MASIQELPVKTLVKVLAKLRGGEIGFDTYRDERTNKKEKLLEFIVKNHETNAIIAAIDEVVSFAAVSADSVEDAAKEVGWASAGGIVDHHQAEILPYVVRYKDVNHDTHTVGFNTEALADGFIKRNPQYYFTAKLTPARFAQATAITAPTKTTQDIALALTKTDAAASASNTTTASDPRMAALQTLLAPVFDEAKVKAICDSRMQDYIDNILEAVNTRLGGYDAKIDALQFPTTVNILKAPETVPVNLGLQHKNFPTLLKMSQARMRDGHRLNIWLKGPAGSGKTTAAATVADALELAFHFNGAISTEYELMGFKDASGTYHRTAFRDAFEHGGVYLFDEIDSSLPKAVLAFNAALANGKCQFPDAQVKRHPDCLIIAGANTAGNGATSDYVGRMKQDLAFLNRFVLLDWPLDEALEKSLAANKDWCRKVQRFRKNAETRKIKGHIISPRATFYGEALLAAGIDEEIVEHAVLRGALSDEQWGTLCQ